MKYLMMWRRHFDSFESMPDELVGQIVKSMGREAFEYGDPMGSGADRMVLVSFVNDAREAREKAHAKSRKNSEAGKAGAEKRWTVPTVDHPPNVLPMPSPPEEKPKRKRFTPPPFEEAKAYCLEKGVNPERWYNHYESNGWMVGKNKMKNWKAAVNTWASNDLNQRESTPDETAKRVYERIMAKAEG